MDEVLINPGIGFHTYQRFNGDKLSIRWGEDGFPTKYDKFEGNLEVEGYPMTTIAFFRPYWRSFEPEMGKYNWELRDIGLKMAHERGRTFITHRTIWVGNEAS